MAFSLKKIIGSAVKDTVDSVTNAVDEFSLSKEEKLKFKETISLKAADMETHLYNASLIALRNETNGNWLQRSWRPIIMLLFGGLIVTSAFIQLQFNQVPAEFWGLMKLGIGGYIAGRTVEKSVDKLRDIGNIQINRK